MIVTTTILCIVRATTTTTTTTTTATATATAVPRNNSKERHPIGDVVLRPLTQQTTGHTTRQSTLQVHLKITAAC